MKTKQGWLLVALLNFLVAAAMGALLRSAFIVELPGIKYQFLLHGHSHVAMLGWIYMALFALLVHTFVPEGKNMRPYNILFWLSEVSVIGMLVSFPVQGYGPVSISFSTIHILLSYLFIWWLWGEQSHQAGFSRRLLKTALFFQAFSTIGIWIMGPIMASPLRHSSFYHMAVQFYLHFQFNGWFVFAILALIFKLAEAGRFTFPKRQKRLFYYLAIVSCLLTYALAVVWATRNSQILLVNSLGVVLQLAAAAVFLQLVWPLRNYYRSLFESTAYLLLKVAVISLGVKILMQAAVAIPVVAEAAYTIRNYIIGFIHLVLLGAVSGFILAYALQTGLLKLKSGFLRWGILALLSGFVLSELFLFLQGSLLWGNWGFIPGYYEILFAVSLLIPVGILVLVTGSSLSDP